MPFRITPIVLNLIIINVLVFLLLNLTQSETLLQYFLLFKSDLIIDRPFGYGDLFKPVQIVGSFFAHIDFMHIFFNMYALFLFGTALEALIGARRFLQEYLIYGVVSGILIALLDPSPNPVLGASTAISGLLVSFAMRFPDARMGIMFLPFSFRAVHYVLVLAAISGFFVVQSFITGKNAGVVSHFGHFAGMAVAYVYLQIPRVLRRLQK